MCELRLGRTPPSPFEAEEVCSQTNTCAGRVTAVGHPQPVSHTNDTTCQPSYRVLWHVEMM